MNTVEITGLIIESIKETLTEMADKDQTTIIPLDESARLFGKKGVLDSLGLVTAIVNIEQKLIDDFSISVTIADERAMSQEKSPFRTVGTLSEFITLLVKEQL